MQSVMADIERDGFSIIRNAINKDTVATFKGFVEAIRANPPSSAEDAELVSNGLIYNEFFSKTAGRDIKSFYSDLSGVVRQRFVAPRMLNSLILSVSGNRTKSSSSGLGYHIDGASQGISGDTLAFWSPLQCCGADAPGLSFIAANKKTVVEYVKSRAGKIPSCQEHDVWTDIFVNALPTFGHDVSPELEPGDVLAFTNWTLHSSKISPCMSSDRSAVIARYESIFDAIKRRVALSLRATKPPRR